MAATANEHVPGTPDVAGDSTAASGATSSPSSSAADEAKARREARKARILGKGSDRLAKLTKQARGDEAELLYPSAEASPSRAATPAKVVDSLAPSATEEVHDDPEEIDISNQGRMDAELQQAMMAFRQQQQQQQQSQQPQDPLAQMMAALSQGGGGPGAGGMPDLGQLFAAMQGQQPPPGAAGDDGMAGMFPPGFSPPVPPPAPGSGSRFLDRIFSLIHIVLFALLGYLALSSTLSSSKSPGYDQEVREAVSSTVGYSPGLVTRREHLETEARLYKWASLAYYRPSLADASYFEMDGSWLGFRQGAVPIFWLFMTLEVLLQSTRVLVFHSRPPPSGLLFSLASGLPIPALQWALKTGARYAAILSSFLDDVAVLVFTLGVGVLWCAYSVSTTS
ncbi:unnamed protein product [Parajaminaea phylloscopi]